jgi:hypothetical protein
MSKRLFISHSWSYSERYNSMVNLLNNRAYFTWTRVRTHNQNMTTAARAQAERKTFGHRS